MIPLRALVLPAGFSVSLLLHARNPARLAALLPRLWPVAADAALRLSPHPVPKSVLAAFRLGLLAYRLKHPDPSAPSEPALLEEARPLLDGEVSDVRQLLDLEAHLEALESRPHILHRLRAAASLVNLIWFVSIAGLTLTFWPTVSLVGANFLRLASVWFTQNLLPVLLRLHRLGVFEAASYLACSVLVAQAARYLPVMGTGAPGSYVALTAVAASLFAFRYTLNLHLEYHPDRDPILSPAEVRANIKLNTLLWTSFPLFVLAPLTVVHQSQLLGFFTVLSALSVLGFFFSTTPFGYVIGFDSENAVDRVVVSCFVLVSGFVIARLLNSSKVESLKPFHLGVMVLGTMGFFLALLIRSSRHFSNENGYVVAQVHMIISLIAAISIGRIFGIESMDNTALVFGALYLIAKIDDLPLQKWSIVGLFAMFASLYAVSTFLRTRPGFLNSLCDPHGFLTEHVSK